MNTLLLALTRRGNFLIRMSVNILGDSPDCIAEKPNIKKVSDTHKSRKTKIILVFLKKWDELTSYWPFVGPV